MFKTLSLSLLIVCALSADETLLDGFDDNGAVEVERTVDESDALLEGFDDESASNESEAAQKRATPKSYSFEGKITQSAAYSYQNDKPHDGLSSLKSLLFLEYNQKLTENFKLKMNGNAFYDLSYLIKGRDDFSQEDVAALESEVELFDAYVQGSLSEKLDIKAGRQVVVWGKSDTIRITDVLNPLDNRRPAMVDIEDLRLPAGMVKLDYYHDNHWRISPIMILEQRFNKNPPFGGDFNPGLGHLPPRHTPGSPSYALDVAGQFSGFDVNFYLADIYAQDELGLPLIRHDKKMQMAATALNYVYKSWLFKGEFAYKKGFLFLQSGTEKQNRIDSLAGFEYNGIAETKISYDFANKHMTKESTLFEQDSFQHALRVSSDFMHASLHANYLLALFGKAADKGGFQRAWCKYDIRDGLNANVGVVDYIPGSGLFDMIADNDMIFMDISYSF